MALFHFIFSTPIDDVVNCHASKITDLEDDIDVPSTIKHGKKTKTIRQKFTQYFSSFKTYLNIIIQCTSSRHKAYIYVTQRLNRRLGPLNPVKCKEAAFITVYMARILPCVATIDFQYPSFRYSIVACNTKWNSFRTYISVQQTHGKDRVAKRNHKNTILLFYYL